MSENKNPNPLSDVPTSLRVRLYAGNLLVKESNDETIWTAVLNKIVATENAIPSLHPSVSKPLSLESKFEAAAVEYQIVESDNDPVSVFAKKIGISIAEIKGACRPETQPPYLTLDYSYYEAFKKHAPVKGLKGMAPAAMSATLLCLWFESAKLPGSPRQVDALAVLGTVKAQDTNASRSIKNCDWLQSRDGMININPAKYSIAIKATKAFCTQNWNDYRQG